MVNGIYTMVEVYSGENVKNEIFYRVLFALQTNKKYFSNHTYIILLFIFHIIICSKKTIFIFSYYLFQ